MMDRVERGEAVDEDNLPALAEHGCLRAESIEETAQEALAALKRREAGIRKARYERELTLTHLAALITVLGFLMTIGFYVLNASVISVYVGELFSTRYRFRGAGISQGAGKAVNVVMPFAVT